MMIVDDDSSSCPCITSNINHLASLSTFFKIFFSKYHLIFLMLVGLVFVIRKFKEDNLRDGRISNYGNSTSNCFNK